MVSVATAYKIAQKVEAKKIKSHNHLISYLTGQYKHTIATQWPIDFK